jgi:hypothetical protein
MKPIACVSLLLVLLPTARAQEKEKWERVQVFEDSLIEIDKANVVFGSEFTGRVRFRISSDKSQPFPGKPLVKYKSEIETIEYKCGMEGGYRLFGLKRYDGKGNPLDSDEFKPETEWREVKGFVATTLYNTACQLIRERKKNPSLKRSSNAIRPAANAVKLMEHGIR